jgi:hypothetical protein
METGEIDSTIMDMDLAADPWRLVDLLEDASSGWGDLPYLGIHKVTPRPDDIDAALEGTFRHHDERFDLSPPIDWWDEPYTGAKERGFFQNSFTFAELLLPDARFPEVLEPLAAIFVDWLKSNPSSGATHPHRYAWHDHAAAGRIVPMAFVLREGIRRRVLDRGTRETLAAGVEEHARYLLAEENYAAHNNHGIASDAALILAAHNMVPVPQAAIWSCTGERRLAAVLDHTIDRQEAIHLEHSPAYHWNIHDALGRFAESEMFEGLVFLGGLMRRMQESGAWLVTPDGTLPPLGDTPTGERPPAAAARIGAECKGMKVFGRSGYAIVKAADSALFVTAAHHPTAHKHADDGSFCLYEGGRPIVLDSGHAGYEYNSPEFQYGTSPAAHATICVDGFDWAKNTPAYGAGIIASAERDGLFALLTRNPNAVPDGGAARRVFVYAPARFLLVIDDVEASDSHQLARHIPLAPGLEARATERGDVEIHEGGVALAHVVQVRTPEGIPDGVEVARGQHLPEFRGFHFVSPEESTPSCDVTLSGPTGAPKAFVLLFDSDVERHPLRMTWSGSAGAMDFSVSGVMGSPLRVRVGESSFAIGG